MRVSPHTGLMTREEDRGYPTQLSSVTDTPSPFGNSCRRRRAYILQFLRSTGRAASARAGPSNRPGLWRVGAMPCSWSTTLSGQDSLGQPWRRRRYAHVRAKEALAEIDARRLDRSLSTRIFRNVSTRESRPFVDDLTSGKREGYRQFLNPL